MTGKPRKERLKLNVRDEVNDEGESSDSDSSGFLTHSTFDETKEERRKNKSSTSNPGPGSPKKSQSKGNSKVPEKKNRGRPSTSTPLQRSPGKKKVSEKSPARKSPAVTPRSRKFRPGTRALMEIRWNIIQY